MLLIHDIDSVGVNHHRRSGALQTGRPALTAIMGDSEYKGMGIRVTIANGQKTSIANKDRWCCLEGNLIGSRQTSYTLMLPTMTSIMRYIEPDRIRIIKPGRPAIEGIFEADT